MPEIFDNMTGATDVGSGGEKDPSDECFVGGKPVEGYNSTKTRRATIVRCVREATDEPEKVTMVKWSIFAGVVMAGAYFFLFKYAKKDPLKASLTALGLYGAGTLLAILMNPMSFVGTFGTGLVIRVLILVAILSGVRSGFAVRKHSAAALAHPAPG